MSISQNFPDEGPSLNLNFASSRTLDPRITFTRTSTGTYTNKNGLVTIAPTDTPRFEHSYNGSNVESLGLLVEESRTNLVLRSNTFNTYWSPVSATCVFTQNATGPDGVANGAWTIDDQSTAGDGAGFEQTLTITPSASTNYCLSIFAKQGTATYFDFYAFFTGTSTKGTYFRYNFSTDTISVSGADGGGITPTIYGKVTYPNGWYRFYFVVNDANSGLNNALQYRIYPASRDTGVTGTTLFYGAQVELASFATSYIPTVASTVTRSADNASMTGTNFSSWYNSTAATGGTISVQARRGYSGNFINYPNLYRISDGTSNNQILAYGVDTSTQFTNYPISTGGVLQTDYAFTNISTTNLFKTIHTFATNSSTLCVNGTLTTTDTSVTLPSVNILTIGFSVGNFWNGTISSLSYYPTRLTNSQLQNLTK
jgi:hypothetical protein